MGLTIELLLAADGDSWPDLRHVEVGVRDSTHLEFAARFTFSLYFRDVDRKLDQVDPDGPWQMNLWQVTVKKPGTLYPMFGRERLSASTIRDLPIHTWETAARERISRAMTDDGFKALIRVRRKVGEPYEIPNILQDPEMIEAAARNLVSGRTAFWQDDSHDMIDPEQMTPGMRRSYESHLKLARTAVQYMRLLSEGRQDPAAEIARIFKIAPGTARTWIHRARQQMYLSSAVGPTAGLKHDELRADLSSPDEEPAKEEK